MNKYQKLAKMSGLCKFKHRAEIKVQNEKNAV